MKRPVKDRLLGLELDRLIPPDPGSVLEMRPRFPYDTPLCDTRSTGRRHPAGAPAARPAATEVGEPRQVRKEAAAAAHLRVPAVHLAAGGPAGAGTRGE